MSDTTQEWYDSFYFSHGPCCAGCDWWRGIGAKVGECTRSAPVAAEQRYAMLGISWTSMPLAAGHTLTAHDHKCGDFKDDFDWSTLPLPYRKRIGELTGGSR